MNNANSNTCMYANMYEYGVTLHTAQTLTKHIICRPISTSYLSFTYYIINMANLNYKRKSYA